MGSGVAGRDVAAMRRFVCCLSTWLIVFSPEVPRAEQPLGLGAQVGPTYGYADYESPPNDWDPGWDWGITAGVFVEVPLWPHVSVAPELRFVRIRNQVELTGPLVRGNAGVEHDYVGIPFPVRIRMLNDALFADLGAEVDFLTSAESESDVLYVGIGRSKSTHDVTDDMETVNVTLLAGIGVDGTPWGAPVAVRIRYSQGLGDASKEVWLTTWKTRELSVSVAYALTLGR